MPQSITTIIGLRSAVIAAKGNLDDMIVLAESKLSEDTFGDHYNEAVALLVLHLYTVDARGGAGGAVTSEKEGQLARSYASTDSSIAYASTNYGQELIQLTQGLNVKFRNRMMS